MSHITGTPPLEMLRGKLVVSCQAYPGEPLQDPHTMMLMAQSAVLGGAVAIRAQGLDDIRLIHDNIEALQIGLWKVPGNDIFITPTLEHAIAVAEAGAEIVAIDGTGRSRPDGLSLQETITELHRQTSALVMADVGSVADGIYAEDAGADCIGTTLSGHTGERARTEEPDLALVRELVAVVSKPVLAEGRIHTPIQAAAALEAGAFAVVVGTAITHPTTITSWFAGALVGQKAPDNARPILRRS
ncbi:N-acetylmannosamine-6-phosphate 2-epimerase [Arthrobacter castelli]|uniref:N-acetylmannosamine-6-phosphate 2-epimerase n=1 Tax=Arthrobacter castelli TaxID=271431 RepID=UPI00068583B1|nr:N-acetylmannosamine-6-phosphate 2-epimerase [Arthrobacter castelli]